MRLTWTTPRRSTGPATCSVAARALSVAALAATALGTVLAAPASAAPAVPYRIGVVCTGPGGSSTLASWPSAATRAPAFALAPVTASPDGSAVSRPAVAARASAPYRGPDGPALAALLAEHGRAGDVATVAEVAEVVALVAGRHNPDRTATQCLAHGVHGAGAAGAAALWAGARRLAGPYTVRLEVTTAKLVIGRASAVSALVTSASGAPVPGVRVAFDSSEPTARLSAGVATTDATGLARTTLDVAAGSGARQVPLAAHAAVPGTPVEMSAPGRVPLVAAGPARTVTRTRTVPVDTTADPNLSVGVDRTVVLPGTVVRPSVTVVGMRGHFGTATVTATGPLPIRHGTGCRGYGAAATQPQPAVATLASSVPTTQVRHDGSYPMGSLTLDRPGCYVLSSAVATSNAIPNVRRQGGRRVVAVAPVHVSVDPAGRGVTTPGSLSAQVRAAGLMPASLTGVTASLVGPVASDDGSCVTARFQGPATPLRATPGAHVVTLSGAPVTRTGCYGFHVTGTLSVPTLGSVPIGGSGPVSATTLVVTPSSSVDGLASTATVAGGHVSARVTVSGSWTQPGKLRLELEKLPYDWRGCFGRDWSTAQPVPLPGPQVRTSGDGTYTVASPAVPGAGCWTVVPVFSLRRNASVSITDPAPIDPMTAFTALPPAPRPVARTVALQLTNPAGTDQVIGAGAGMLILLTFAAGSTLSIAVRERYSVHARHRP